MFQRISLSRQVTVLYIEKQSVSYCINVMRHIPSSVWILIKCLDKRLGKVIATGGGDGENHQYKAGELLQNIENNQHTFCNFFSRSVISFSLASRTRLYWGESLRQSLRSSNSHGDDCCGRSFPSKVLMLVLTAH
jgi:hypothetical protein